MNLHPFFAANRSFCGVLAATIIIVVSGFCGSHKDCPQVKVTSCNAATLPATREIAIAPVEAPLINSMEIFMPQIEAAPAMRRAVVKENAAQAYQNANVLGSNDSSGTGTLILPADFFDSPI